MRKFAKADRSQSLLDQGGRSDYNDSDLLKYYDELKGNEKRDAQREQGEPEQRDAQREQGEREQGEGPQRPGGSASETVRTGPERDTGDQHNDVGSVERMESESERPEANPKLASEEDFGGAGGRGPEAGAGNGGAQPAPEEFGVAGPDLNRSPSGTGYSKLATAMRFSRHRMFDTYGEAEKLGYRHGLNPF